MNAKSHLIIVGFSQLISHKYIPVFKNAMEEGYIDGYSVIDVESQKSDVNRRISSLEIKPEKIYFLPDPKTKKLWADPNDFGPLFQKIIKEKGRIKAYIATEVKAHEAYLRYCAENGIDSLTEKPIIAPMKDGQFDPTAIEKSMAYIINRTQEKLAHHSIMTLSRYHKIYNDTVLDPLKERMTTFGAPITSFHFRTAGGVWNLHREYDSREDHPYKYGYGMLMHGAYHYIDLTNQFLELNKLVFPENNFSLTLSSFAAYPSDQVQRIPEKFSKSFDDYDPRWSDKNPTRLKYGETDITTTFCLKCKESGKVITLGTISLEQTTPSIRAWRDLPHDDYNKNGRTSSVDIEVQLSTLYSINVQCFDVPIRARGGAVEKIDAFARVITRANASILENEEFNSEQTFSGLFHSDSNRTLIKLWLRDQEEKSLISAHVSAMRLTQAIALSLESPGQPITIDY
jgi:hypothetical protein